jgi:hypothetical protein
MQRGRCPDTLLRALGVKWSLSPQLFASRGKDYQRIMDHELPAAGDVVLLQNALPGPVLREGGFLFLGQTYSPPKWATEL